MRRLLFLVLILTLSAIPAATVTAHSVNCANAYAPHSYGMGGSAGVSAPDQELEIEVGVVVVSDNNTADCNGDGIPYDFDGDYEAGMGGGFFGAGPWANEPTCQYGLVTHGTAVTVTDAVSANIAFKVGADDQGGPVVIADPINGGNICETDGGITPCAPPSDGGACGPTDDADDCLSDADTSRSGYQPYVNSGSACGTGGDGGYWVFLLLVYCSVDTSTTLPAAFCSGAPTAGFIAPSGGGGGGQPRTDPLRKVKAAYMEDGI